MCQILVDLPNEVLFSIKMDESEMGIFVRGAVAKELYKTGKVSLGYCAQIAGMAQSDFINYLGGDKISIFNFDEDEFEEELEVTMRHS